jgi:hypothetical protein
MGLFTEKEEVFRAGSRYLSIVGPFYAFYGVGMALYFATQGLGRVVWTVTANGIRMLVGVCGGLMAVFWLNAGPVGFFAAVAGGFVIYGVMNALVLLRHAGVGGSGHANVVASVIRAPRPAIVSVLLVAFLIKGVLYGTAHAQVLAAERDMVRGRSYVLEKGTVRVASMGSTITIKATEVPPLYPRLNHLAGFFADTRSPKTISSQVLFRSHGRGVSI